MKTKIALAIALGTIASFCIADLATAPDLPVNVSALSTQLAQTKARAETLENRVAVLEQTVARLQREVNQMQQPKVIPVLVK